jgi:hypothetical protein
MHNLLIKKTKQGIIHFMRLAEAFKYRGPHIQLIKRAHHNKGKIMLKAPTCAEIKAMANAKQQGEALRGHYAVLLQTANPDELTALLRNCLAQLAQNKVTHSLAIELLHQIYTVDGGYSSLFLTQLQVQCFEAVLPDMETHPGLSMCTVKLWSALTVSTQKEPDDNHIFKLLAECPKMLGSIPMLSLMSAIIQESGKQSLTIAEAAAGQHNMKLVLLLLQQLDAPIKSTTSFQKEIKINALFNTLLDVYVYNALFGVRENPQHAVSAPTFCIPWRTWLHITSARAKIYYRNGSLH